MTDKARFAIEHGGKFPYDASDAWWSAQYGASPPPSPTDWAHVAARGVLADLQDRRDIKRPFEEIDEDVRVEIVEALAAIIRLAEADRASAA